MIYRNVLGDPEAMAAVSFVRGGFFGSKDRFVFHATSNAADKTWEASADVWADAEKIASELRGSGWDCEVSKSPCGDPVIRCIHAETQAVIDTAESASNAKFANAERGYIRFGEIPVGGKSKNYRDGTYEAGLSVFDAEFVGNSWRIMGRPELKVTYLMVADRESYRVYGEQVGAGADGEPVVDPQRIVKL